MSMFCCCQRLNCHKSALIEWQGIRLSGQLTWYIYYVNVQQCYVIHTLLILLHRDIQYIVGAQLISLIPQKFHYSRVHWTRLICTIIYNIAHSITLEGDLVHRIQTVNIFYIPTSNQKPFEGTKLPTDIWLAIPFTLTVMSNGLKYKGNSISKLQIQVATYAFELSAGNCQR
jgi:hypothetical protein